MKTCPDCGHSMKDTHRTCVKCGAETANSSPGGAAPEGKPAAGGKPPRLPAAEGKPAAGGTPPRLPAAEGKTAAGGTPPRLPAAGGKPAERLKVLKAFVPTREAVRELLPHPAGWVLGIGVPAVVLLMIVHGLALPGKSQTRQEENRATEAKVAAENSRFKRCLAKAREKADLECAGITGTAAGMRRMTCTAARLSADYTRCTASQTGRVGACLGRCGQEARTCSSSCAILGGADQDWTDTAKCLVPCWAESLGGCASACFRTGGEAPARPQAAPSDGL